MCSIRTAAAPASRPTVRCQAFGASQWRCASGALLAGLLLFAAAPVSAQRAFERFESGDRIRVWLGTSPTDSVEGRFWSMDSGGIRIADRRGRPFVFAWERIERVQGWLPTESGRRRAWRLAAMGAIAGGAFLIGLADAFDDVAAGPDTRTALLAGSVGALSGAWLGWAAGHALTYRKGTWIDVPLDRLRPPP